MPLLTPTLPSRWVITGIDVADDPDVFPYLIGQSFIQKAPLWSTSIKTSVSGVERRRALWPYPNWRFGLGIEMLRDTAAILELKRMVAFFNSRGGSATGFFYYDHTDNQVTNSLFGVGDGAKVTFQLMRVMTVGSITYSEPVRGFNGAPTIYVNGVATAVTVNPLGTVIFASAPAIGAVLTWTGSFYFLCRFEKDELEGLAQIGDKLWELSSLSFLSYKP